MKDKLKIIKFSYSFGAILDGIWAVLLAYPPLYKIVTNNKNLIIGNEMQGIFYIAASLMLGWTILLCWGYKDPIGRRFLLLITAVPAVLGIFIGTVVSFINGHSFAIIFVIKTFLIMILFILTYIKANKIAHEQ